MSFSSIAFNRSFNGAKLLFKFGYSKKFCSTSSSSPESGTTQVAAKMKYFKALKDISPTGNSPSSSTSTNTKHVKHKTPKKRSSSLLSTLKNEEFLKLKSQRNWPEIKAGDSIMIEKAPFMTSPTVDIIKGVVIAKTNRFSDTAVTILNCEHGTPIVRRIIIYNPLIRNVTILQKAFIHKGKKRVRRSKIYYLMNRDPEEYTVPY